MSQQPWGSVPAPIGLAGKTAGLETMSIAGIVAAVINRSAAVLPVLNQLRATNPTLYASILAAVSAEAAARVQQERMQQPQQPIGPETVMRAPHPGMLL